MICPYCSEPFVAGEPVSAANNGSELLHQECMLRMVIGSVGHQRKACSCFGGVEEDPPGATLRQSALAAAAFHRGRPDA